MSNQQNSGNAPQSDDQKNREFSSAGQETEGGDSGKVDIQPSEPNAESAEQSDEDAPGRTPGKAEGTLETVEADLDDKAV